MSFEDDAYWEWEYADRAAARSAVARDRAAPAPPVDELAARRRHRDGRYRTPARRDGRVQKGFDTERPSWLDDPHFVPTDVSGPDLAGPDSALLDVNRPELGAGIEPPSSAGRTRRLERREGRAVPLVVDDDWDDEIDEPYDHRVGMDRRSAVRGLDGYLPSIGEGDDQLDGHGGPRGFGRTTPPAPGVPRTAPAPRAIGPADPAPALTAEDLRVIRWRLDGATLREVADDHDALRELGARLDGPLAEETSTIARAGLLNLRAEVYRLLGELGMAAAACRLALAQAESAGDVDAAVIAQAELAHVLRLRGDFAAADRLFEEAASSAAPDLLRSVVHENAGRSCFEQGRHMEALDHFARAIRLGAPDDLDLVERIDVCLEAVYIHVVRDGWGPYPRLRREILGA